MEVTEALLSRSSKRQFLDRPVPRSLVEEMLRHAGQAPSGSNTQPWRVHALAGAARDSLVAEALAAARGDRTGLDWEYQYYPVNWREPYLSRRRACGWGLYSRLGIAKGARLAGALQELRNFELFGAPVGLFFFIDRDLEKGSWLDYGMFLQSVMLMARQLGLDTCPQAAWVPFHSLVRRHTGATADQAFVCGMALGYADPAAPVNTFKPARIAVDEFAHFEGFEDAR
jgi:nitroreductase